MADLDVTIDTYLAAWTEPDAARRATLVRKVWAQDGRLIDPPRAANGRRGISRLAAILQVEFPGYTFVRVGGVDERGNQVCFAWRFVGPDGTSGIGGVDVAELAADGRLQRITRHYGRRLVGASIRQPA